MEEMDGQNPGGSNADISCELFFPKMIREGGPAGGAQT